MTVAVSFCAFNASGATVNVQEVTPTYVGFVYGKFADGQMIFFTALGLQLT